MGNEHESRLGRRPLARTGQWSVPTPRKRNKTLGALHPEGRMAFFWCHIGTSGSPYKRNKKVFASFRETNLSKRKRGLRHFGRDECALLRALPSEQTHPLSHRSGTTPTKRKRRGQDIFFVALLISPKLTKYTSQILP